LHTGTPLLGDDVADVTSGAPRRIFLSHTSDLGNDTMPGTFVAAAVRAVLRAHHAVTDMAYFAARDTSPAKYCVEMVARSDVYVGIIGLLYGSIVRDRTDVSYTELEFETAGAHGQPRLIFLIRENSTHLPAVDQPEEARAQQEAFRARLLDSVLTVKHVSTPADLELEIYQALVELGPRPDSSAGSADARALRAERRDRHIMLERVRAKWIVGVLRPSLERTGGLDPALAWRPEALDRRARLQTGWPGTEEAVPTRLDELFDRAGRALLVLGAPGSGKTVLLLQLAERLAHLAEIDETQPMPAVFNLASWARRQPPLEEWLAERLVIDYQVPARVARIWVRDERVLPLLDGLDEVPEDRRAACAGAIDRFREAHGFLPIAVTSRSQEYGASAAHLQLLGAVEVQPLLRAQVERHLAGRGRTADGTREALREDPRLWELAETPLLLDVLLATNGDPAGQLGAAGYPDERQRWLFDGYVEAILRRRGGEDRDPPALVARLAWLARQLIAHSQVIYYPEEMQTDWLARAGPRRLVTVAPSAAVGVLFVLAALAALALDLGLFMVLLQLLTGALGARWAYAPRVVALGQAWWSWDVLARVAVMFAWAAAFIIAVALPLGIQAALLPVNGAFQLDELAREGFFNAYFASIAFGAVAIDPLRRWAGQPGPARSVLLTGLVTALAAFLVELPTRVPLPLALATAAVAGLVAAGVRAAVALLPPVIGPDRPAAAVQALLAGAVAAGLDAAWRIVTGGSVPTEDIGHYAVLVAGWALLEAGIVVAAADIALPRATGRSAPVAHVAGAAVFVTLAASFAVLLLSGVPFGLRPNLAIWPLVVRHTAIALVAFAAVTVGPGAARARRLAEASPVLSAEPVRAAALAAALGLGFAGVAVSSGYTPAASAAMGLLLAFVVVLVRAAVVGPARVIDQVQLRRRTAVAGLSAAAATLIQLPGGDLRSQLAYTATFGLLALMAARALLVRVDLPDITDDAAGRRSPGRAAVTALLFWAVLIAGYVVIGNTDAVLGLGPEAVPVAALAVLAYAVVGCLGVTHLDRSRVVRPGQATKRAIRDSAATGLFAALSFALLVGAGSQAVLLADTNDGFPSGYQLIILYFCVGAGLPAFAYWFLRSGGRSLLQLLTLRLLLSREGALPWRAVEFLDEMTRLGLLRRAGSGYLFPHRLLMEHFAAQAEPVSNPGLKPVPVAEAGPAQ